MKIGLRKERPWSAAAAIRRMAWILAACQIVVVWILPHPVGTDLPAHYTILSGLTRLADLGLDRYLECRWYPSPYMLTNGLFLFFRALVDWETATKCVLTAYLALLPACVLYWVRSFPDPDDRKALFAAAFAANNPVLGGNYHILFGLLTLMVVLGYWFRTIEAPSVRRSVLLASGMLCLYFHHFATFAVGAVCLAVAGALHPARRRLLLEAALACALPGLSFLAFVRSLGGMPALAGDFGWTRIEALYHRLAFPFGGFGFWGDLLTQLPTVLAYLWLAARGLVREGRSRPLALALAAIGALAVCLPAHGHYHMTATRLVFLALFLGLPLLSDLRGMALAAAVAGTLAWNAYVAANLAALQGPVGSYIAFLDRIPPHQAVFPLYEKLDATSRGSRVHDFYSKLVNHYHVEKGGVSPHLTDIVQSPWEGYLRYRDVRYKSDALTVDQFDAARYAPLYPWIVYKGGPAGAERLAPAYGIHEREGDLFLLKRSRD